MTPMPVSRSKAAARDAAAHPDVPLEEIGRRHGGLSRQAVQQAIQRLASAPRPRGRKPRAGAAATSQIALRFPPLRGKPGSYIAIRVTDEERAAFTRAAGELELADWLRAIPGVSGRLGAAGVRRLARRAAGMPEE